MRVLLFVLVMFEIVEALPSRQVTFEIDWPVFVRQPALEIVLVVVPELRHVASKMDVDPTSSPRSSVSALAGA